MTTATACVKSIAIPVKAWGAALRTYLRVFRGVHKYYLAEYVATFETLFNAKAISPAVVQAMCWGERLHARDWYENRDTRVRQQHS
jgi:hypothetical protein